MRTIKITDNFINKKIYKTENNASLVKELGYFPNAKYHYIKRKNGVNEYILIFCTNGEGYVILDNRKIHLIAKTFIVLDKNKEHTYYASDVNPWSIYWCHFKEFALECVNKKYNVTSLCFNSVIAAFEHLLHIKATSEEDNYINLSWQYIINTLMINTSNTHQNYIIEKLNLYMQENIANNLTLKDFEYYANLSSSQLCKIYKKHLNTSPFKHYLSLKIEHATTLLLNTNLNINEIAKSLGFEDQFYFSRLFKKQIGKSPLQFRKDVINN